MDYLLLKLKIRGVGQTQACGLVIGIEILQSCGFYIHWGHGYLNTSSPILCLFPFRGG